MFQLLQVLWESTGKFRHVISVALLVEGLEVVVCIIQSVQSLLLVFSFKYRTVLKVDPKPFCSQRLMEDLLLFPYLVFLSLYLYSIQTKNPYSVVSLIISIGLLVLSLFFVYFQGVTVKNQFHRELVKRYQKEQ